MESDTNNCHQPVVDAAYLVAWFRWRQAIDQAEAGDTTGIINLLHAGKSIPPQVQLSLANFLERHQLKKKQGGQRRLELSPEERKLIRAAHFVQ